MKILKRKKPVSYETGFLRFYINMLLNPSTNYRTNNH